jgi:hypothetical protein
MAKEFYEEYTPRRATLELIERCNEILEAFDAQGYDMTLRQLYYQLVAANQIPNNPKSYDKLGGIINKARLAGLIDWNFIVDRRRNLGQLSHWNSPGEILEAVSEQYKIDKWASQTYRPEVWFEKDALSGVFSRAANEMDVPYFATVGYNSQSEMWRAGRKRLRQWSEGGQTPIILYFGDHDPSGLHMTVDVRERLELFCGFPVEVRRLALNISQIEQYKPPPNFAKDTDSRFKEYEKLFGTDSWEIDALNPEILSNLVKTELEKLIDFDAWNTAVEKEKVERGLLQKISQDLTPSEN